MNRRSALAPVILAGALLALSACSPNPTPPPSTSPPTSSAPSASVSPTPQPDPTLPVAPVFGEREWGKEVPEVRGAARTPVVTARHLIVVDDKAVRAYNAQGASDWEEPWTPMTTSTTARDYPVLRQVSPDVVALIDVGKTEDLPKWRAEVNLLNIEDGKVLHTVVLDGTTADAPVLGPVGLGFVMPDGKAQTVGLDGQVTAAPIGASRVDDASTVGTTALSMWGTKASMSNPNQPVGFGTENWDSLSLTPNPDYTAAELMSGSVENLLVGRWYQPAQPGGGSVKQAVQVVKADEGNVTSSLTCVPETGAHLSSSPNRQWSVMGSLRIDFAGNAVCAGEKERGTTSTFTAVTDSGRAFGTAKGEGVVSVFVDLAQNGQVTRHDLDSGVTPPIGVMEGDLAIHWDWSDGVVTANPISD